MMAAAAPVVAFVASVSLSHQVSAERSSNSQNLERTPSTERPQDFFRAKERWLTRAAFAQMESDIKTRSKGSPGKFLVALFMSRLKYDVNLSKNRSSVSLCLRKEMRAGVNDFSSMSSKMPSTSFRFCPILPTNDTNSAPSAVNPSGYKR